jgi:hypothetical protein
MGILSVVLLVSVFTFVVPVKAANTNGFDEFGYNRTARIFVGTGGGWCAARKMGWDCAGTIYAPYAKDRLVMKWNAEWDRGNAESWVDTPYAAWENNEWNGAVPGGSGEVWHYKIQWVGVCGATGDPLPDGGYCIWGQFEVILDHGTSADHTHVWFAHALPTGYGA